MTTWAQILALSSEIVERAKDGGWEQVQQLHDTRENLIRAYFSTPIATADVSERRRQLEELLALEQEVQALAAQNRQRLGETMHQLGVSRQVSKAYLANDGRSERR